MHMLSAVCTLMLSFVLHMLSYGLHILCSHLAFCKDFQSFISNAHFRKSKQTISKLEELYESTTLVMKDILDDGADSSIQGPALRKLHGSLLQRRMSVKVNQL